MSAAVLAWWVAPAAAGELRCPERHDGARLATVSVFDGPPSEHADLVPDTFEKTTYGTKSTWDVSYIFTAGRRLYVQCDYGAHADPVILQPGPMTYACEFLTRKMGGVALTCRSH